MKLCWKSPHKWDSTSFSDIFSAGFCVGAICVIIGAVASAATRDERPIAYAGMVLIALVVIMPAVFLWIQIRRALMPVFWWLMELGAGFFSMARRKIFRRSYTTIEGWVVAEIFVEADSNRRSFSLYFDAFSHSKSHFSAHETHHDVFAFSNYKAAYEYLTSHQCAYLLRIQTTGWHSFFYRRKGFKTKSFDVKIIYSRALCANCADRHKKWTQATHFAGCACQGIGRQVILPYCLPHANSARDFCTQDVGVAYLPSDVAHELDVIAVRIGISEREPTRLSDSPQSAKQVQVSSHQTMDGSATTELPAPFQDFLKDHPELQ